MTTADPMLLLARVATTLLAGGLPLLLAALVTRPGRSVPEDARYRHWLPWIGQAGLLLALGGGLAAALAHVGQAAFLLAILGMSFVFQRTHVLRLIEAARCPAQRGDRGASRQLGLARALWWGVAVLQIAGAWLALWLLAYSG